MSPSGFDLAPAFTDDVSGTIADLVFQPGNYGPQVVITLERDEPFTAKDGTLVTEKTIYVGLPDGWDPTPGPDATTTIVNADPSKKITATSAWGRFCERVVEIAPEAVDAIQKAGGGIYSSAGWAGHRFHFETEGAGKDYSFTDEEGVKKEGKTKGYLIPTEYLGTKDAPVAGDVGASAPVAFAITSLPDDVIEAWSPLADANDEAAFKGAVLKTGLLTPDKLGDAYGPTTAALGDGSLREALVAF